MNTTIKSEGAKTNKNPNHSNKNQSIHLLIQQNIFKYSY